jgi:predicted  nucleic acid-binding Zn-ribbon protein
MTVPKTVLAVALLLLAAAAAAQWTSLQSTGPYDVRPGTSFQYYLLWFPPHAVPMNLTLLNVTWFRPEAIWFVGKYPVHVCRPDWCGYVPATIYVVQDGVYVRKDVRTASYRIVAGFVEWHIKNRFCAQGTAMVAPNKIIVLNHTTQIWISDIYCLHGNNWFWLRLLPYILSDELTAEGVEAVEFRDPRVHVRVPAAPPGRYVIPGGWYLDPATKKVFRIPSDDAAVMAELQRLRLRISELEAELANKTAQLAQLNATAAQLDMLNATIARLSSMIAQLDVALTEARGEAARLAAENQRLRAQLEALNYTRAQLEEGLSLYRSRLEVLQAANATLTAQLTQLKAENSQLKAKTAELNESLAKLNEAYTAQVTQLRHQLEAWTRAAWIGAAVGAAAGAAAAALALRRRR